MRLLRNRELLKNLRILLFGGVLCTAGGFMLHVYAGCMAAAMTLLFMVFETLAAWRRYRSMAAFTAQIDALLHGGENLDFSLYCEGELSLLQNEVQKMTIRLREQAEQLAGDKTRMADFLADVSHQVRTPLTAIQLLAVSLRDEMLTPGQRGEKLGEISRQISRIDWLINSLLKMARLDAGTVILRTDQIAFSDLIGKAAAPFEISMELQEQRLALDLSGGFTGDLLWSAEAVGNIIKNCIEHMGKGGTLRICGEENAIYSQLSLQDDGPGIAQEDLPHLFERFYRGHGSGENNAGIGLSLARRILREQNATVKAENARAGGALFTIRFYKAVS